MDKYAKAIVGALAAGLGALGIAQSDGHITGTEWVYVAATVVGSLGLIWGVPNAPAVPPAPPKE
jgi:hypothetical protein